MAGSSSSMGKVVVIALAMSVAAAYTGADLAQAARDQQWSKVREILNGTDGGQDLDLNVRAGCCTALHWASYRCEGSIVQQLVLAGADVNLGSNSMHRATPVMEAARHCSNTTTSLRALLSTGEADLTLTDTEEWTALHYAARWNNTAAVPLLLEAGAPPGAQDLRGRTAVELARHGGYSKIIHLIDDFTARTTPPNISTGVAAIGSVCFAVSYILHLLF